MGLLTIANAILPSHIMSHDSCKETCRREVENARSLQAATCSLAQSLRG